MQNLAQLESAELGRTPLRWSGRLKTDLRRVGCQSRVSFLWKRSIDSTHSLSSCYGPPWLPGFVNPRYKSGRSRILCVHDEVSKPELNDLAEITSNGSAGVDSMTQKGGSNYFSALEKDKNLNGKLSAVTKFNPRRPFDLTWIGTWADEVSERGMHKRRTFYSHDDWLQHRSSTRHYRHFTSTLSSRVIVSLIPPVGTMTAISVAISIYNSIILSGWLPSFIPLLHGSPLSYQLTAPALALLLVFRTEASYSRYDEARKTWTKVISSSKDMARQSMTWAQRPDDNRHKKLLLDYILAFSVALKCHLLYNSDFEEELSEILEEDDLALVLRAEHRPNCLIQLISNSLKCIQLEDGERSLLDANISQFNESISICERIIRTPIPLAYTRLTSRILVLWHLALPVVLWDDCQWVVVPATFISAASLFCIEEVGVLIEEPFPILALDRMCSKARENIQEIAKLQLQTQEHLRKKITKVPRNGVANGVIRS